MDNQGLTTAASPKFAVDLQDAGAHTHGWGCGTLGPCPSAPICWEMLMWAMVPKVCWRVGVWAHTSLSLSLSSLPTRDSIKWGLTLWKIVFNSENAAKDSTTCWLPAGGSVNFLPHFLQVIVCLLENISTLQLSTHLACCSITLNLFFLLDICESSF